MSLLVTIPIPEGDGALDIISSIFSAKRLPYDLPKRLKEVAQKDHMKALRMVELLCDYKAEILIRKLEELIAS